MYERGAETTREGCLLQKGVICTTNTFQYFRRRKDAASLKERLRPRPGEIK